MENHLELYIGNGDNIEDRLVLRDKMKETRCSQTTHGLSLPQACCQLPVGKLGLRQPTGMVIRPIHTNIYTHTHVRVKVTDLRLKNRTQTFPASFRFDSRYRVVTPRAKLIHRSADVDRCDFPKCEKRNCMIYGRGGIAFVLPSVFCRFIFLIYFLILVLMLCSMSS